jgi:hypothetical protein
MCRCQGQPNTGSGAVSRPQSGRSALALFLILIVPVFAFCHQGCLPTYRTIVSGGPFSRSITDPASTTLATGFCLFISVTPEFTNAEAKAFAAFLVAKDDFRRTASVMPQPLSPCVSDIDHPDTCPKKNLIEFTKPRISSASLGSGMPDGLILISIFCPAKGRIASTNDFATFPKAFLLALRRAIGFVGHWQQFRHEKLHWRHAQRNPSHCQLLW